MILNCQYRRIVLGEELVGLSRVKHCLIFFPEITKSSARAYDYVIRGLIDTGANLDSLEELAKSADTNVVVISRPPTALGLIHTDGLFAVKTFDVLHEDPLYGFIEVIGGAVLPLPVQLFPYTLTLTQLADTGEVQEGIDGFLNSDEDALGLQGVQQLVEAALPPLRILDTDAPEGQYFGPITEFVKAGDAVLY